MTNKTYQIEDDFARGLIENKCKIVASLEGQNIETDLIYLQTILGNKALNCLYIGRGGNHIWISDVYKKRIAIIYYH